ncbi:unnamed protein product [Tuber aestivum]|uniref:F-actin-capping protein subunit beta n=1 Tax=Tuber aestivum TaxID=59557 RepID=A0A292PNY8_9PEZI|nr:unnamed protein product [Tuber aestivum]
MGIFSMLTCSSIPQTISSALLTKFHTIPAYSPTKLSESRWAAIDPDDRIIAPEERSRTMRDWTVLFCEIRFRSEVRSPSLSVGTAVVIIVEGEVGESDGCVEEWRCFDLRESYVQINGLGSDLLRRLNPKYTANNVNALINLVPDLTEDLLSSVDQPLQVQRCKKSGRDYLLCDYNRDGDSYRSPWSNEFDPPLTDGTLPSERVRRIEIAANDSFDVYRELYYEGGVSSVYFWNLDDGFAGVVLLKKCMHHSCCPVLARANFWAAVASDNESTGSWDSIHVFEATDRARISHYKLTSTVILNMINGDESLGEMDLSGNMTRQVEQDMPVEDDSSHIANIGKLVEDMELKMRNLLQEVYFGKAKDVVGDLRSRIPPLHLHSIDAHGSNPAGISSLTQQEKDRSVHQEMISSMSKR